MLLRQPKSRTIACASGVSFDYTKSLIKSLSSQTDLVTLEQCQDAWVKTIKVFWGSPWTPKQNVLLQDLRRFLVGEKEANGQELDQQLQRVLAWSNVVYLIGTEGKKVQDSKTEKDGASWFKGACKRLVKISKQEEQRKRIANIVQVCFSAFALKRMCLSTGCPEKLGQSTASVLHCSAADGGRVPVSPNVVGLGHSQGPTFPVLFQSHFLPFRWPQKKEPSLAARRRQCGGPVLETDRAFHGGAGRVGRLGQAHSCRQVRDQVDLAQGLFFGACRLIVGSRTITASSSPRPRNCSRLAK